MGEGQHAGGDDDLARGNRLGVSERHQKALVSDADIGRRHVAHIRHQLLHVPIGVAEEAVERDRRHPVDVVESAQPVPGREVVAS